MKKSFLLPFILCYLFSFSQTGDEIILKNLEATAGIQNWEKLESIYLKGEAIFGLEESYPVEIYQKKPNLTKTFFTIQKKKQVIESYNGKKSFQYNFATKKLEVNRNYVPENFDSDLLNFDKKGFKALLLGKEKIDKFNCHKVTLSKNNLKTTYYFDVETYYLIKEENEKEITIYLNYKKVDNYLMPFRLESYTKKDKSSFVLDLKSIKINQKIENSFFN